MEMPVKSVLKQHIKYNLLPVESVDLDSTSVSMSSFLTSLFALETCFKTEQKPYENGKSLPNSLTSRLLKAKFI